MMMEEVNYETPLGEDGRQVDVSIFAEGGFLRREIAEDCAVSGLHVRGHGELAQLVEMQRCGGYGRLSDVIVVDCPQADAPILAALMQLDAEAAGRGKRLVVATTLHSLDDVFGCLDQSVAHILVRPSRAERMMLLTRLKATLGSDCVREMAYDDRLTLLRLTEQVERMARSMAGWQPAQEVMATAAERPAAIVREEQVLVPMRQTRTPLPDPRFVRSILRQRQKRSEMFGAELFADPAWDMLLDLTAARAEHRRVSITSLCIASGVPATTALRWIGQMVDAGLFERVKDSDDARRAFVALTDRSADAMARYFADVAPAEALAA